MNWKNKFEKKICNAKINFFINNLHLFLFPRSRDLGNKKR